ncbi:MAG: hypothetical protein U0V87_11070 [Acidobacteriota bacterium]
MPEGQWEPRSAKEVLGTQVDDTWPGSSLTLRVDVPDGIFGPKHFDAFSACLISALGMDEPTINVLLRDKYRLRDLEAIPATIISCAIDFDRIRVWRASHDG